MGDDFGLGRVGGEAVGGKDGAVVLGVGLAKLRRHCERVVEIGKRGIGIKRARRESLARLK